VAQGEQQRPPLDVQLDDHLTLSKAHPCGSSSWRVVRLGADIGLTCNGCGHRVLLERPALERRLVKLERAGQVVER
jgi:hypothetical protein